MKDLVEFQVYGRSGKTFDINGFPSAYHQTPADILARYVISVTRTRIEDLRAHRDVRPVPTDFAVTYSDNLVTNYRVMTTTIDNVKRDAFGDRIN